MRVSTTTLTFTEAPLSGDVIEVRKITNNANYYIHCKRSFDCKHRSNTMVSAVVEVVGDLNPKADGTQDLGSAAKHWLDAHLGSAVFYDADDSATVTLSAPNVVASSVAFKLPGADGTAGQAMVTDASGNLSFAAAGATISSQTLATNTNFLLYFASTTTGALTAVKAGQWINIQSKYWIINGCSVYW